MGVPVSCFVRTTMAAVACSNAAQTSKIQMCSDEIIPGACGVAPAVNKKECKGTGPVCFEFNRNAIIGLYFLCHSSHRDCGIRLRLMLSRTLAGLGYEAAMVN